MNKLENVKFHDSLGIDGPVEGSSFLVADGMLNRSVRTKSTRDWTREAYSESVARGVDEKGREIEGKEIIHFISYDPDGQLYLLESAVRIGKGYQRQEAKITVEDLTPLIPNEGGSTEDIVRELAAQLTYVGEGFAEKPAYEHREYRSSPIAPDDVLATGRGALYLSDEHREIVRQFITADPIEKKDLPDGVLTLTETLG